jgi:hypothetical protein
MNSLVHRFPLVRILGHMRVPRPTEHQDRRVVALALAGAVALGIAGRLAVHVGGDLPHGAALSALGRSFVALGAPWLAVAWTLGFFSGSRYRGAWAGGIALSLGTVSWYLLTVLTGGAAAAPYAVPLAFAWGLVALPAGALFGFAGAAWRDGNVVERAFAVAGLAGALAGEALLLGREWTGRAADFALYAEMVVAVALLWAARRKTPLRLTVALFALAAIAMAGAEHAVRDGLRLAGWAGP